MPHVSIPDTIAAILRRSTIDGDILHLPEQLAPKDYVTVKKIVENAGGKWKRGKGHVFQPGGIQRLLASLESGTARDTIKDRQAFYTPRVIASDMALFACCDGKTVLEPSCGGGSLIKACIEKGASRIVGIEIDEPTFSATSIAFGAAYPDFPLSIHNADFLEVDTKFLGQFDRVVMNPPFTRDADLKHVLHAWQFVAPGGRLVALTSPGWTFSTRGTRGTFTDWMKDLQGEHERLPDAEFGRATVQVVRIVVTKPGLTAAEKAMAAMRALA